MKFWSLLGKLYPNNFCPVSLSLFADDTFLRVIVINIVLLSKSIFIFKVIVFTWLGENSLMVNKDTSKFIDFRLRNGENKSNHIIEESPSTNTLSMDIDVLLYLSYHIGKECSKLNKFTVFLYF